MNNRYLISVAAAALIAGAGFANAQGTGGGASQSAPSAAPAAQQSAPPSSERGSPSAAPMNRNDATQSAPADAPKAAQSKDMDRDGGKNQRAQDNNMKSGTKGEKSAQDKDGMKNDAAKNADSKAGDSKAGDSKAGADSKNAADSKSSTSTTGQAGAGGKLTTEQRTKVTTVIKSQNIRPETNVNFSVSIGTRVPREVRFHPLPAEIITVYPDWRGYEFFLVGNDIIVVNPRTLEIVAVIDA